MCNTSKNLKHEPDPFKPVADAIYDYLYNLIYKPSDASLDVEKLPPAFQETGKGLLFLGNSTIETRNFAKELAVGNLDSTPPPPTNEIASSLKMLHSSLKHLTWQTQQVAKGDYRQRVDFMGDFSVAFNNMIQQLEERQKIFIDEKTKLEMYVDLILENCPNPILLFDSFGKLAYISNSFFRYCKTIKKDVVLGKKINDLFAPIVSKQSMIEIEHLYKSAIEKECMFSTQQKIDFGNPESSSHFEIQITPMHDTDGSVAGIIMFLFDMTQNIKAQHEAEHARQLAEQSSHAKSIFIAKMSHEIRTPMNAILGMAELALRENISPATEEYIRTIRQAGNNLLSIINDILDLSKIETGKLEIIPMGYSFPSLVNDVINIIRTKVLESRLRFIVNIDCEIPNSLFGDAIRIRQILLNLLSNAVKYTERGYVSFNVQAEAIDDNTVLLIAEVNDSGKGIKQEEIKKLFSEFSRLDGVKNRDVEGTGLGLAICRNLVSAMGGKIDVKSEYGKGSTFKVSLPQKIRDKRKTAIVEHPGQKNVLIYERREIYCKSIAQTMENLGVKYKIVSTTPDFIGNLESSNYSNVILASIFYNELKKNISNLNKEIAIAVITELGETMMDRNICTLTMPVYCLPIANFLNSSSDIYAISLGKKYATGIIAPEAKVLIVDDVNTNLKVAEGLLKPYKMQVKLCKSGIEAIREVKTSYYDLILMDHMMPEMDGVETVMYIRALGEGESYGKIVPIVALTADAVFGTKEMLLKNGFNDYLSKPIDVLKLNAIIEKWIPAEKQKRISEKDIYKNISHDMPLKIKINGINTKKGLAMTGGNAEAYLRMLSTFHKDATDKIKEIAMSLGSDNIQLYVIHVHALKSASAIIGAGKLSEAAAALEEAGKKGDSIFINSHNAGFISGLETLLANINAALAKETEKNRGKTIDIDLLKTTLSSLKTALNNYDSPGINNAENTLHGFLQASQFGDSITAILQNRLIGELDEAESQIDTLLEKLEDEITAQSN